MHHHISLIQKLPYLLNKATDESLTNEVEQKRLKIIPVEKRTRCIIVIVAVAAHPVSVAPFCPSKVLEHMCYS